MAGTIYIRQSSFADGDTITAALFNNEFNQLANAFAYTISGTTGHTHDGTDGQGGNVSKIGDQDFKNKIVVDTSNNRWGVFVEVGGVTTEQVRIQDGAFVPVVDSDINLGSPTAYFKDSYIDTVTTTGAVTVGGALSAASFSIGGTALTATITELNTLDGITSTVTELNYTDGVTSNIQTQLNAKQPLDAQLTDIAALTPTNGTFIVGDGTNFVAEAPATALASLGVTSTATELNVLDGITATTTELNYVHNVTSPIQTQLNAKQALNAKLTDISNLTLSDNFFLVSTGSNLALESPAAALTSLGVTATAAELNYVDGVTSNVQTQLDTKSPLSSPTFTGTLTAPIINASSDLKIGGTTIAATATELNYLSGVTSSVQTQLDALQASDTDLSAIAALTPSDGNFIVGNGTSWVAESGNTVIASLGVTATATELNYTDGVTSNIQTQLDSKAPLASPTFTGTVTIPTADINGGTIDGTVIGGTTAAAGSFTNVTVSGTVDGRDIASDGSKLDTIETNADVTDTTNVTAAGALMDSELTDIASVKALNQGVATTDDPTFTNTLLASLDVSIADTATDVFVYDTRKDSDGGAWRKRTQHTSWYNETLNTATRGSRKEFPAVAVIVAESKKVTIYDGDDPSLPMWMVFESGADGYMLNGVFSATLTSVVMKNAVLATGAIPYALNIIDFLQDTGRYVNNSASGSYLYKGSISERNDNKNKFQDGYYNGIVNSSVNDVAMTVLPNAPIDAATGLPVPTIAVATAGGVSVITDSGAVYDTTVGFTPVGAVSFDADGNLFNRRSVGNDWCAFSTFADYTSGDGFGDLFAAMTVGNQAVDILGGPSALAGDFGGTFVEAGSLGLGLHKLDTGNFANSLSLKATSNYNTGWMNGNIKLATLSDTDDTDVTGSQLVTNGTFDTDVSGWTLVSVTASVTSGEATFTDSTGGGYTYQALSTIIGETYTVSYSTTGAREAFVSVRNISATGAVVASTSGYTSSRTGSFSITFTAEQTTSYLRVDDTSGAAFSITVDNISVRIAEEDRSVNGNGLQVFGTITKNPVATGADLVAYSGFSASNYLEQPYNADLQFGTGDFCFSYWIKFSSIVSESIYSTVGTGTSSGTEGVAANTAGSGVIGFAVYTNGIQSSGRTNCGFTYTPPTNTWICVQNVRRSGVLELWINGELDTSVANTADINATDSFTRLGGWSSGAVGDSISLSLFRASATAPTAEQIAKIYEDEKVLFQENSQATLYGSSDSVTALAYDDDTELLHVGTSAGRSVFQGLRRIDNTTDAVGAAISASNGMVAED